MRSEQLAYWIVFSIPGVCIILRTIVQRLVDGPPWKLKSLYVGLDLSIFSLAAAIVNIVELLNRQEDGFASKALWSLVSASTIALVLFFQATIHQKWERPETRISGKTWMLCVLSNGVGLVLIAAFVYLKLKDFV